MFTQKNVFGTVCVTECSGTVPCNVKVMRRQKTKCVETEHNFILGPQPDNECSGCSDFQCSCIYVRTYVYICIMLYYTYTYLVTPWNRVLLRF